MRCINRCRIPESELDDAVELGGNKLLCSKCFNALFPLPKEITDSLGRPTNRTGKPTRRSASGTFTQARTVKI